MRKLLAYLLCSALLALGSSLHGQSAKKYVKSGDRFYEAKQYEDAHTQYSKARELDPERYEAYVGMGKSLFKMGRPNEAFEEFQRAAVYGPKEAAPYHYLGKIQAQRGVWSEAVVQLEQAEARDAKNSEILTDLFRAQTQTGAFDAAMETAEALRKANRGSHSTYIMAVALDSLGRNAQAETNYRKARFEDPSLIEAYIGTAHVRYKQGLFAEGIEDCNKAIEKDPANTSAFHMRSKLKLAIKDFDGAISDLSAVLEMDPADVQARWTRAKAYQSMGQYYHSINDWTAILKYQPDNFKALYERAADYEATNNFESAIKDYQYLRRLSPYDENAAALLAAAQDRLFDLNREGNLPEVEILNYAVNSYSEIEIPGNLAQIELQGRVLDESPIKQLTINGADVVVAQDSIRPSFEHILSMKGLTQVVLKPTDVYGNQNQILYKVKRTEVDPPSVQLLAPYSDDAGILSVAGDISELHIEGKVRDESFINRIMVNGVMASFMPDQRNPKFSADLDIANHDFLTVEIEDVYGNESAVRFQIERDGTTISENNPMGRTWVVFVENSNYQSFASIDGPAKDVNTMKQAFSGYHIHNTIHKIDMTKEEMERFFSIELRDLVRSNAVNSILVWYAGHGKFINNTGYWIPVDAERDDEFSYFNINTLKAGMQSYSNYLTHTLVVTDACESGPSFADITRDELPERRCDDWEAARMKSSQVFSSAGYELASDNSQFTRTFSNMLTNNPMTCLPIERVVIKVRDVVRQQGNQSPKFGVIDGLDHEDGTFFFMRKAD